MTVSGQNRDALTQALAEPSRRSILDNLRFGPKSVTELVEGTGLKQPNVSNHLAKMRVQKIVRAERIGRNVYYGIALPIADLLMRLHEYTRDRLEQQERSDAGYSTDYPDSFHPPEPESELVVDETTSDTQLPVPRWRASFFHSVRAGQEDRAQAVIHEMLANHVSLPVIYTEIFERALVRVGELYEQGVTDEAHEHLVTELTERMMARVAQFYTPVLRCGRRAILGCVAGNWHTVGLRMLSDALRVQGWETLFLGANVPTNSFVAMANSLRPDLVIISCGMEEQMPELRQLLDHLQASRATMIDLQYRVMIGGQVINARPEVAGQLPADMTARDLSGFLEAVASVFGSAGVGAMRARVLQHLE